MKRIRTAALSCLASALLIAGAACAYSQPAASGSTSPTLTAAAGEQTGQGPWVFSYFTGNGEDGLHMAYSKDGLHWEALNGGKSLYDPKAGSSKLVRDPCIIQGPDGVFQMVWTTGWDGLDIGHSTSTDLIHWAPPQVIDVMAKEPTARNSWAPEIIWDDENKDYLIFWASTIPGRFPEGDGQDARLPQNPGYTHRIYSTTTTDFKTFAPTKLFYDPGFNAIDSTIRKVGGRWLMIFKNETNKPFPVEKNLRAAWSDHAAGPYSPASEKITGDYWAEGPTLFKKGDEWVVMFDKYILKKYGALSSKDGKAWTDISDQIAYPNGLRHGTVLPVSQEILDGLLALK
jgi:hypothetical protein